MAGRASIVGAAETSVGKVRDHNEDAHFIDPELGIFLVCDGMGGHAAGEVASALAVSVIRHRWSGPAVQDLATRWLNKGTLDTRKQLLTAIRDGVIQAHNAIIAEAEADKTKGGMGTTLVGALLIGGDIMFAHAGDSRAYLVRDGIAMQLTEDHTLLARLLAAGVEVDTQGEGARFKSMLTNALGIGQECKVSTFVVPVADGDRFLLCSDGITEYLQEAEIGEVLTKMPSPARSAQRLVEIALQRGGGDNATALVVRVLEAGETARPSEMIKREEESIRGCPLWSKVNPQQRLRALRIALPRDHADQEKIPAQTLGDRVAWVIVDGIVEENGKERGPGSLLYPEALLADRPLPDRDGLAVAQGEVRALALRSDDFRELCEDDPELAEILLESLGAEISLRRPQRRTGKIQAQTDPDAFAPTLQMQQVSKESPPPSDLARASTETPDETKPADPAKPAVVLGQRSPGTSPPPTGSGATLPNVPSGPHPRVKGPSRAPTPAGGVMRLPTPPTGVARGVSGFAATPPTGVPQRTPTPAAGVPLGAPIPPSGGALRAPTPASGPRTLTPPTGSIQIPPLKTPTPAAGVPVTPVKTAPPAGGPLTPAKAATPPMGVATKPSSPDRGLIVPQDQRAAANQAVDNAVASITVDDTWGESGPNKKITIPPPLPAASEPADDDEPREIIVEADEPEPWQASSPVMARPAHADESEPEISIEELASEADGAQDDSSQPEISIFQPGRAITSQQMKAVSGAIGEEPEKKPPRAKRRTDAPE
ncbi:MAG: cyclic nucleotide-binding protein [Myxococcales bacterium]|nr:cyclic nucleotide-binding protein [Myxococcales bacterium]